MSYHMLNWTIEDDDMASDTGIILQIHNSKNISIHGDTKSYFFQKDKRHDVYLSIASVDKCNRIIGMSNNVYLPPSITCK